MNMLLSGYISASDSNFTISHLPEYLNIKCQRRSIERRVQGLLPRKILKEKRFLDMPFYDCFDHLLTQNKTIFWFNFSTDLTFFYLKTNHSNSSEILFSIKIFPFLTIVRNFTHLFSFI